MPDEAKKDDGATGKPAEGGKPASSETKAAAPEDKNKLLTAVLATGGVTGTTAGLITALTTKFNLPTALAIGLGSGALVWFVKPKLSDAEKWRDKFWASRTGHCHKKFIEYVVQRNRNFDVKGLSTQGPYALLLDQVFVHLRMNPKRLGGGRDPVAQLPESLAKGAHPIEDFLKPTHDRRPASLAITGAPGSGKTTLLKSVALRYARLERKYGPMPIPILLYLREHAKAIQETESYSLPKAAVADLLLNNGPETPEEWFADALNKGRAIVLLDGLDEVADPAARKAVVAWVEKQRNRYGSVPYLLTSRPAGYEDNPVTGCTHIEVLPFTRKQQTQFVNNWYLANEIAYQQMDDAGVREDARKGAAELLEKIRSNAALSGLAVNPLLLTMIATVHRYRSSLPGRRVELYAEICEVFLGKRRAAIGLTDDLTPAQKIVVLQELAFAMMQQGLREITHSEAKKTIEETLSEVAPSISAEAFLKAIEHGSGLLLERESGRYGFAHLTFQEYLAARYINDPSDNRRREKVLLSRVSDPFWAETVRLYCAISSAPGAVILACLEKETIGSLSLALECLAESQRLEKNVRDQADAKITKRAESDDPEVRKLIGEAYLTRRLRNFVRESDDLEHDTLLITGIEYELFLRENLEAPAPLQWRERRCPVGEALKPALGMRCEEAYALCEWLTTYALEGDKWKDAPNHKYRLPRSTESLPELLEIKEKKFDSNHAIGFWVTLPKSEREPLGNCEIDFVIEGKSDSSIAARLTCQILQRTRGGLEEEVFYTIIHLISDGVIIARAFASHLATDQVGDLDSSFVSYFASSLVNASIRARVSDLAFASYLASDQARDLERLTKPYFGCRNLRLTSVAAIKLKAR